MGDNKPKRARRPVHERIGVAALWSKEAQQSVAFAATGPTRAERYTVALEVPCPRCKAARRAPCSESNGNDMGKRVHVERFELASGAA